jgi:hypothetical protein
MRRRHLLFGGLVAALAIAFACSGTGRWEPFCADTTSHLCFTVSTAVCCHSYEACGDGNNGCPSGDCCPLATEPSYDKDR